MMLSVLIVNYRVRFFLEHCLLSVLGAVEALRREEDGWMAEVLVIDNDPNEGSLDFLRPRFPSVRFFAAPSNLGFGKANNFLLDKATGKYVLFLNPDTIVPENAFTAHLRFLEATPAASALGTRMIDGSGSYLPESKRGFPGVWTSFCKMAGLSSAFPSSRIFAGYYQGHLDQRSTVKIPILSGAYMLVKSVVIENTGGFDEQFFMYAEDIDLSYRFQKAGYENYYFADTTIIHFKGESTRKDQQYVKQFYLAMIQFVRKHFTGPGRALFIRLLELAIRVRAGISTAATKKTLETKAQSTNQATSTCFLGDAAAIALCRQQYGQQVVITDEQTAMQTVFCLGSTFTHADLIAAWQTSASPVKKVFHANAEAIISSNSKSSQGSSETFLH